MIIQKLVDARTGNQSDSKGCTWFALLSLYKSTCTKRYIKPQTSVFQNKQWIICVSAVVLSVTQDPWTNSSYKKKRSWMGMGFWF